MSSRRKIIYSIIVLQISVLCSCDFPLKIVNPINSRSTLLQTAMMKFNESFVSWRERKVYGINYQIIEFSAKRKFNACNLGFDLMCKAVIDWTATIITLWNNKRISRKSRDSGLSAPQLALSYTTHRWTVPSTWSPIELENVSEQKISPCVWCEKKNIFFVMVKLATQLALNEQDTNEKNFLVTRFASASSMESKNLNVNVTKSITLFSCRPFSVV